MWPSGLEDLKKLNVSDGEVNQLVVLKIPVSAMKCASNWFPRRTTIAIRLTAPPPQKA